MLCGHGLSLVEIPQVLEKATLITTEESIVGNTVVFKVLACSMIVQTHCSQGYLRY